VFLVILVASGSMSVVLSEETAQPDSTTGKTDNAVLTELLEQIVGDFEGEVGRWNFTYLGVEMILLTNEEYDRMRVIAPVADSGELSEIQLRVLLEANFNRALDAKYALFEGNVWSIYVHPLSNLSKTQLISALRQVASLRHTYGTSFSSMDILFGGDGG
jgi:hypothetical protein